MAIYFAFLINLYPMKLEGNFEKKYWLEYKATDDRLFKKHRLLKSEKVKDIFSKGIFTKIGYYYFEKIRYETYF